MRIGMFGRFIACPLFAAAFCGCTYFSHPSPPPAAPTTAATDPSDASTTRPLPPNVAVGVSTDPKRAGDPHPIIPILVRLNVYQLTVPSRTVSHNDEFWKHVDEHAVDPAAYDVLYKNGLRVGIAQQEDWTFFRNILNKERVVTQISGSAGDRPTTMELDLKKAQPAQEVFWFDSDNFLTGQRYDWCQDILSIYFTPTPRHPGDVSVTIVPLLRSTQERLDYTLLEDPIQPAIKYQYPAYLFDLRLRTTIPVDSFLVIGPSPLAHIKSTLGQAFLMLGGKGEEFETIILISPLAFRLDDPTTQPSKPD